MNWALMIAGGIAGAAVTSLLQKQYGLSAVVASSLVGLLGAGIGSLLSNTYLPAAIFAGSFVGMTAVTVAPLTAIAIAGAGAGALFTLVTASKIFPGYGGKLGSVAFISTTLVLWISGIVFKK